MASLLGKSLESARSKPAVAGRQHAPVHLLSVFSLLLTSASTIFLDQSDFY